MKRSWFSAALLMSVASLAECASEALAQPIGTFRWQLQPYCNVLSLTVTQNAAVYALDGFDDLCGAPQRASIVGTAVVNPDGSVNLGMITVLAPSGLPVHIDARVDLGSLGGTWRDSAGNSGAFTFTAGPSVGGAVRPVSSTGLYKRSTFRYVNVPPAGSPPTQLTSVTFTSPVTGIAELRGRGFCNLASLGPSVHNQIVIAAGTSAAVMSPVAPEEAGIATVGHGSISTIYQPAWSSQSVLDVVAGSPYTVGLFGMHAAGNQINDCSGTLTVQIFAGSLP